jgi:hypothetical protein
MFLLFIGYNYYPSGGWHDYKGSFHTLDEAEAAVPDWDDADWYHIVLDEKIVESGDIEKKSWV